MVQQKTVWYGLPLPPFLRMLHSCVVFTPGPSWQVWIDNFAVRQFPGNGADLDFSGVINRCKAVLLVGHALPGVAGLSKLGPTQGIPQSERALVATCRVWCLAGAVNNINF